MTKRSVAILLIALAGLACKAIPYMPDRYDPASASSLQVQGSFVGSVHVLPISTEAYKDMFVERAITSDASALGPELSSALLSLIQTRQIFQSTTADRSADYELAVEVKALKAWPRSKTYTTRFWDYKATLDVALTNARTKETLWQTTIEHESEKDMIQPNGWTYDGPNPDSGMNRLRNELVQEIAARLTKVDRIARTAVPAPKPAAVANNAITRPGTTNTTTTTTTTTTTSNVLDERAVAEIQRAQALLAAVKGGTPPSATTAKQSEVFTIERGVVAVLPLSTRNVNPSLREILEETIRTIAGDELRPKGLSVLTGETTLQVLSENGVDATKVCEASCALEAARELKARLFISGSAAFTEGEYTAFVRMFDSKSGQRLGSVMLEGKTMKELRQSFQKKAPALFEHVRTTP